MRYRALPASLVAFALALGLGVLPAHAGDPDPACMKRIGYAQVQCHGVNINMDTGSWKTDAAGHAYYIYTKTPSNVSMNHNYYKILCSDSWAGQCRFQDF